MGRGAAKTVVMLVCVLAAAAAGCAVDPVSGRRELMLLSESDEVALGQRTDRDIVRRYGLYADDGLGRFVSDLGRRLGAVSHRPQIKYVFKVLDSPVVNAFAVPGGYVYMTRGILAAMNSEAELAGVLGHEIGHITARHSAEQYSRAQVAQMGLGAAMIFSETARAFADLAQFGVGMLFLKFSRDNEREADGLGVEYASRAGYDAGRLARFFQNLERMRPRSDRAGLPAWFSTHPNPEDRQGAVLRASARWRRKLGLSAARVARDAYLRRLEGLVYGEDPRQGYVASGVFYHPILRFRFPVPVKWPLRNTPEAVRMISPRKDATLTLTLAPQPSAEKAAWAFVDRVRAQVSGTWKGNVHGLPTQGLVSRLQTSKGPLQILSLFVEKGGKVFAFHGWTTPAAFRAYRPSFERTMGNFAPLTDRRRLEVRPERIRIRRARPGTPLSDAFRAKGVPQDRWEETALLNGLSLEDPVPAGGLLKIIRAGGGAPAHTR